MGEGRFNGPAAPGPRRRARRPARSAPRPRCRPDSRRGGDLHRQQDRRRRAGAGAKPDAKPRSGPLECTLRAALRRPNSTPRASTTSSSSPAVFNGETGDTISPGSLLPKRPTGRRSTGSACNGGSAVSCLTPAVPRPGSGLLVLKVGQTKVEHLSVIHPLRHGRPRASGGGPRWAGVEILDNTISMTRSRQPHHRDRKRPRRLGRL